MCRQEDAFSQDRACDLCNAADRTDSRQLPGFIKFSSFLCRADEAQLPLGYSISTG